MEQEAVIEFLARPDTHGGNAVARVDTHISVVFLAGERAFKLKRALAYPYLDFTSLAARHRYCLAELAANRRTAPMIYQRVAPVWREAGGALGFDPEAEAPPPGTAVVEWVVVMRRFDDALLFDHLVERGELSDALAETLAEEIARFHAGAALEPGFGGAGAIGQTIDGNAEAFTAAAAFPAGEIADLTAASHRALRRLQGLLERRREGGFVRRCHGDLHLRNICLVDGRPVLFDAIEFSDAFACIDTLYDLSFLLMDLDFRGRRDLANRVLNRYLDVSPDYGGLAALGLFLSCRAAIRAHTGAAAACKQGDAQASAAALAVAQAYLDRALVYLNPARPALVAVGGLSGSGKSRCARGLAPHFGAAPGAVVLRTDVLRKRLAGVDMFTKLGPEGYTPAMNVRTYDALRVGCREVLAAGRPVVADAVFARPQERETMESLAREMGVPFLGLWLEATPEVMAGRIASRRHNASDATVEVLERQLAYDLGDITWRRIDSSGPKTDTAAAALAALRLAFSGLGLT